MGTFYAIKACKILEFFFLHKNVDPLLVLRKDEIIIIMQVNRIVLIR
jgi:hypothetical protein